jgi:hypothetical protein
MPLFPKSNEGKILFVQSKVTPWSTNATQIGTTTTAVTSMGTLATTAQAKLLAAVEARDASKNATADLDAAVRAMGTAAADIVKQIRAKAATDGDDVYLLAGIPAPATPSPVGPPGTPYKFGAALDPEGVLTLTWKCANPAGAVGTVYQIGRKLGGPDAPGEFAVVGTTGKRRFVDATLTAGAAALVTYQVRAIRSTLAGTAGVFTVQFGIAPSGSGASAAATLVTAPKLAA